MDAYLLSESSLFVWDDRILILTCGQTKLIRSVLLMIEEFGAEKMASVIYQRKNEFRADEQHSSFLDDVEELKKKKLMVKPCALEKFTATTIFSFT